MVLRTRSAATSVTKSTPRKTLTLRQPDAVLTDAYEMNWSTVSILRTPESPKILMFAEPPASTCRHDGHVSQNSPGPWSPRQLPALATAAANASLAPSSLPTKRYACASLLVTRAASRHRVAGQSPTASLIRFADTDYLSHIINSGSVTLVSTSLSTSAQDCRRQVYTPLPACAMTEFHVGNEETGRQRHGLRSAFHERNRDGRPECCPGRRHPDRVIQGTPLPFKPGIMLHGYDEVQVAGLTAVLAGIPLSCDTYFHAAVDTCRNRHLYSLVGFRNTRPLAGWAWRLYNPAFAAARRTNPGSHDPPEDRVLNLTNLALAIAGGANLGRRA